jgi:hypothetical protein
VGSTPNPGVAVNARSVIPDCPEFVTVTNCVPLTNPICVGANVSCAGDVCKLAGVNPVPFKLAVAVRGRLEAPLVVLDAVRVACRPPAPAGLKITETRQLPPPPNVCVQFAELAIKSAASAPETAKLNPAIGNPPAFETVTDSVALEKPIPVPGKLRVDGLKLSEAGNKPVPIAATCTGATPRLVVATVMIPF